MPIDQQAQGAEQIQVPLELASGYAKREGEVDVAEVAMDTMFANVGSRAVPETNPGSSAVLSVVQTEEVPEEAVSAESLNGEVISSHEKAARKMLDEAFDEAA